MPQSLGWAGPQERPWQLRDSSTAALGYEQLLMVWVYVSAPVCPVCPEGTSAAVLHSQEPLPVPGVVCGHVVLLRVPHVRPHRAQHHLPGHAGELPPTGQSRTGTGARTETDETGTRQGHRQGHNRDRDRKGQLLEGTISSHRVIFEPLFCGH